MLLSAQLAHTMLDAPRLVAAVVRRPVGASALSACPASAASTDGGTLDLRGQQLARQGWIAQRAPFGGAPQRHGSLERPAFGSTRILRS
jgi:hypothetical protein